MLTSAKQKKFTKSSGFTLIEILVVLVILAVVASGVVIAINPLTRINQAKDAKIRSDMGQVANAMQAYFTVNQVYPSSVSVLVPSDLKVEPKDKDVASFTVTQKVAASCTPAVAGCEVSVYAAINAPITSGNVLCWKSSTGVTAETTVALCAP